MNKILIVEDDNLVANIYRNKFQVEGFKVEVALDGEKGLELLQSFKPDAIIMDLMLPKMTGVELMRRVRSEPSFEKIPIIVFSNTYLTNLVQDAWKAGATKCLSKANCNPRQVIEVVRTAIAQGGAAPTATPASAKTPAVSVAPIPAPTPTPAPIPSPSDDEFQGDLQQSFLKDAPETLARSRMVLQGIFKTEDEAARLTLLNELYRRIHALSANAGIVGFPQIAQLGDALEALLRELHEKPKQINASTLRTVASAIDFLGTLVQPSAAQNQSELKDACVLVVDDETISRRAVTHALEKAHLRSVNAEDPNVAYKMLTEHPFDLIFLDVDMPGMTGFELCTKLRSLPAHKKTPVVFVTSLNDFESRANSTMSGGNDFIAKPFLFIELAVKALCFIMRGRMTAGS